MMSEKETITFWDEQFKYNEVHGPREGEFPNYLDRMITFFGSVSGKRVLDVGCGLGEYSIALSRMGASVTAIDTSDVAIEKLNSFARRERLNLSGVVYDAIKIGDLEPFDFVVGAMILHHLEPFSTFCESLDAAMKADGKACFYENNAANKVLMWFRQHLVGRFGIPKYGDDTESPLSAEEVDLLRSRFTVVVDFPELFLFRLAGIYLFRRKTVNMLTKFDNFLGRWNTIRPWSYRQILFIQRRP